jgi:dTMP kinase
MGSIIALEGPDGVGKSTVAGHIIASCTVIGKKAVRLVDPGTTRLGTTLRPLVLDPAYPMTPPELCLLFAAMSSALVRCAADHIANGIDLVVLDRCFLSNYPYRMADGVNPTDLDWIYDFADAALPADKVFILTAPASVRQARLAARPGSGADRFESKPARWRASMEAGYDWCLLHQKGTEIDANRPPEVVAHDILGRIGFPV